MGRGVRDPRRLNSNDDTYSARFDCREALRNSSLFQMRMGILRSPDKTHRGERADDEDKNSDPESGRRRGVPVRLDGRDDGFDARLRQSEPTKIAMLLAPSASMHYPTPSPR